MASGEPGRTLYHRRESPTQTPDDAARQEASGELWGQPPLGSHIPKVKAYPGPLPAGAQGIEFVTDVPPDAGSYRGRPEWSGPRPGVVVQGGYAKIRVIVTRNTQI